MKNVSLVIFILLTVGLYSYGSAEGENSARAIQIITSVNQTLHLQLNELKNILEADEIKDRHVMVVSIVGASRTGKSFLLNIFIKYLNAQYKKHNVSDWIGEDAEECESRRGFKWRYVRTAETIGIWMWSEIFTHDFENGKKVAIILLDTQGLFDRKSSKNYYSSIVALNMIVSSVQCYNVMSNIQQDSLEYLDLFAARGRLALGQLNQKPFQKLLFIVRDWHYADEINYGWNGQQVVDELFFDEDSQQSSEISKRKENIKSSFDEIGAFLMPSPGKKITDQKNSTGCLHEIEPKFIQYLKELVPDLFAPDRLNLKKINGEHVRARELVLYLQTYINIFNGNSLPEVEDIIEAQIKLQNFKLYNDSLENYIGLMKDSFKSIESYLNEFDLSSLHQKSKDAIMNQAKCNAQNMILFDECAIRYNDSMESTFENVQTYLNDSELWEFHLKSKDAAINQFLMNATQCDDKVISDVQQKIQDNIEHQFSNFKIINDMKRTKFMAEVATQNMLLSSECVNMYINYLKMSKHTSKTRSLRITIINRKIMQLHNSSQSPRLVEK